MGKADLHIHTTASDGKLTPERVVTLAAENNLEWIALTDHDTIEGYLEAREAAEELNLTLLAGVELTTNFHNRECHMLAYCFDPEHREIRNLLKRHKEARVERADWIIEQLRGEGLELNLDEVKAQARGGNVGRPHIASVLVRKGYVASAKEAFIRYLSDTALGPIQNYYTPAKKAISLIKKAGGATVLAHPGVMYDDEELNGFVEAGIDGIETIHPSHNYELQKKYEAFAEHHGLLQTGGSDYHGYNTDYLRYFGVTTISKDRVRRLLRLTDQRSEISV